MEWKLLFGLARYAGLRTPSESHQLTWADVEFEEGRLRVRCTKTEHHVGRNVRFVPIGPELLGLLKGRKAEISDSDAKLVRITGNGRTRKMFDKVCKAAKVEKWERIFQTLRSSCEKHWAMSFPEYAVAAWLGHSPRVSRKHYTQHVPKELYERATAGAAKCAAAPARTEAQATANGESDEGESSEKPAPCSDVQLGADTDKTEAEGFEPPRPLRAYRFSRPAQLTALPRLRGVER